MRLLVVGLALLASGAWAQHSFVDRDTELLALPSDQLIHSDVELEAVESAVPSVAGANVYFASPHELPFGAKLPGYEKVDYAYGYQIRENQKIPTVRTTTWKPPTTTFATTTASTTTERTTTLKPSPSGTFHAIFFPAPLNQQFSPPDREYLPPPPSSPDLVGSYLPPDLEFKSQPPPPPSNEYLPPDPISKTEAPLPTEPVTTQAPPPPPSDEYLPPDPVVKTEVPLPSPPSGEYLPPDVVEKTEAPILPPPSDEYLPPDPVAKTDPPVISSEYLPPPPDPANRTSLQPLPLSPSKPPTGAAWQVPEIDPVIVEEALLQPLGIHTDPPQSPLTFGGQYSPFPPLGVVGVPQKTITADREETARPPLGILTNVEDPPLHFESEVATQPPLGVISEVEDDEIRFQSDTATLAPFAVTGEIQTGVIQFQSEVAQLPPFAVVAEPHESVIRVQAEQPTLPPYAVVGEPVDNAIEAEALSRPLVVGAIPKDNPACHHNVDCSEDQICMDGLCVNACVIATDLCVGHATCVARRHVPGCVCPNMFTAVTVRRSGQEQYDCMPMMMMATDGGVARPQISVGRGISQARFLAPIVDRRRTPIAPLAILSKIHRAAPSSRHPPHDDPSACEFYLRSIVLTPFLFLHFQPFRWLRCCPSPPSLCSVSTAKLV